MSFHKKKNFLKYLIETEKELALETSVTENLVTTTLKEIHEERVVLESESFDREFIFFIDGRNGDRIRGRIACALERRCNWRAYRSVA